MTLTMSLSWLHSLSNPHVAEGKTNDQDHPFSYHRGGIKTQDFLVFKARNYTAQMMDGLLQRPSTCMSIQNYRIWDLWK